MCTDTHLQDCCGERQFEKVWTENGSEKVPNKECLFMRREKGLFLPVHADDIKIGEEKNNLMPIWDKLRKPVDLEETNTSVRSSELLECSLNASRS